MTSICGYRDIRHFCGPTVQFILRYKDQNDYCLNGKRLTVYDSGLVRKTCEPVTVAELNALRAYFAAEYVDYVKWHHEKAKRFGKDWPALKADDRTPLYADTFAEVTACR